MISMWALVDEGNIESYAGTIILPTHLSHLRLAPFKFASQTGNSDGCEPLVITYVGEGRFEEFNLYPAEHALGMIEFVCSGIDTSRVQLPQDDASWSWTLSDGTPGRMRVFFAPTVQTLNCSVGRPVGQEAYVSVSRGHAFIGRSIVESYIQAWLRRLRIDQRDIRLDFPTPSSGIEFVAGAVGGEMFLDDETVAEDLMRFAGLDSALADVGDCVEPDLDADSPTKCGVFDDGVYINLSQLDGEEL